MKTVYHVRLKKGRGRWLSSGGPTKDVRHIHDYPSRDAAKRAGELWGERYAIVSKRVSNPRKGATVSKRKKAKRNPKKRHAKKRKASKPRTHKRKAPRKAKRNPATAAHYTVVFPSAGVAREFIETFPSKSVRAIYRKELTPIAHGAGFKSWRASRATAEHMAAAILQRLAWLAGRRRRRFTPPKLRIVPRA